MDERKEFIFEDKNALRKVLLEARKNVADRLDKERAVADALLPMLNGNCLLYVSIGGEVSTLDIIERLLNNKSVTVYAPYTVGDRIYPLKLKSLGTPDRYGNLPLDRYEHFDINTYVFPHIDFSVTPLLGFDDDGYRLGYGKGCYDKYFSADGNIYKIGLAFEMQKSVFSHHALDVPLDCCITESGVVYFNHARDLG